MIKMTTAPTSVDPKTKKASPSFFDDIGDSGYKG